jgi:phosphoglycolate phosphatase
MRHGEVPSFPVYLFDIDGTVLDSVPPPPLMAPTVTFDFLKSYIGRHLVDLFTDLFPHHTPEQIEQLIVQYRALYPARGHKLTSVYPGVAEGLAALDGLKGSATTKGTPTTRAILQQFGLLQYFDHVQGTDGFPCKPAPDVIFAALKALGASPGDCLFVGDSAADMEAGRRAGVTTCAVLYGYGKIDDLARFEPDYWIDDLRALAPKAAGA